MTGFCAIYTGRLIGHTMKFASFPISDAWLIKVTTCVNTENFFDNYGLASEQEP